MAIDELETVGESEPSAGATAESMTEGIRALLRVQYGGLAVALTKLDRWRAADTLAEEVVRAFCNPTPDEGAWLGDEPGESAEARWAKLGRELLKGAELHAFLAACDKQYLVEQARGGLLALLSEEEQQEVHQYEREHVPHIGF